MPNQLETNVSQIQTKLNTLYELTNNILGLVPFATATDAQISAMLNAHYNGDIDLSKIWNIGDTRVIHIDALSAPVAGSNRAHVAQDMTFRIIGFKHDNLTTSINGITKAAVTIECREIMGNNDLMENDYISGSSDGSTYENPIYWDNAYRRIWLNNDFVNALPSTFNTLIKEVVKGNLQGHNNTTSVVNTNDKAFFLSYPEVFGQKSYANYRSGAYPVGYYEGIQYEYYINNSSNKKVNNNGSAGIHSSSWWLRSPASMGTQWCYEACTSPNTCDIDLAKYTKGISPALCI